MATESKGSLNDNTGYATKHSHAVSAHLVHLYHPDIGI